MHALTYLAVPRTCSFTQPLRPLYFCTLHLVTLSQAQLNQSKDAIKWKARLCIVLHSWSKSMYVNIMNMDKVGSEGWDVGTMKTVQYYVTVVFASPGGQVDWPILHYQLWKSNIYIFKSTTISSCLNIYKFRNDRHMLDRLLLKLTSCLMIN